MSFIKMTRSRLITLGVILCGLPLLGLFTNMTTYQSSYVVTGIRMSGQPIALARHGNATEWSNTDIYKNTDAVADSFSENPEEAGGGDIPTIYVDRSRLKKLPKEEECKAVLADTNQLIAGSGPALGRQVIALAEKHVAGPNDPNYDAAKFNAYIDARKMALDNIQRANPGKKICVATEFHVDPRVSGFTGQGRFADHAHSRGLRVFQMDRTETESADIYGSSASAEIVTMMNHRDVDMLQNIGANLQSGNCNTVVALAGASHLTNHLGGFTDTRDNLAQLLQAAGFSVSQLNPILLATSCK